MTNVTFAAVAERISAMLDVPADRIAPDTEFNALGADSFRLVEMVVDLQEEFDSTFTQAALKRITTIGELVQLLADEEPTGAAEPVPSASAN